MENMETMGKIAEEIEEVITVVEMPPVKNRTGLKIAGGTAVVGAVGYGIYKLAKWVGGKRKAKKEQEEVEATCVPCEDRCENEK